MVALCSYTSTEAVRACLGLDSSDCSDKALADSEVALELIVWLDSAMPGHAATFAAGRASGATDDERTTKDLLTLYAQWFCAYEVALRPLQILQAAGDGKNQMRRFDVDMSEVRKIAGAKKAHYFGLLDEALNGTAQTTEPVSQVSASTPAYDPVTGA